MKKILLGLIVSASLMFGMATILDGETQTVSFTSSPNGANVFLNGNKLGVTPLTIDVPRESGSKILKIEKDGYQSREVIMQSEVNSKFFINIFIGGVFGSSTDYATKAMFQYKPNSYFVELKSN